MNAGRPSRVHNNALSTVQLLTAFASRRSNTAELVTFAESKNEKPPTAARRSENAVA